VQAAQASEGLVVTSKDGNTHVGIALMNEGERFGGIDLELAARHSPTSKSSFLRCVQTFAAART